MEFETFYPATSDEWRNWLLKNHQHALSIWLVGYKKNSGKPTVSWSEAVDQALCFGWIDGTRKSVDGEQYIQFFTRRKPKSAWSKINKEKIHRLISDGLMTEAGLKAVETAKANGSWYLLDGVEELLIPDELNDAFKKHPGAGEYFETLSKSIKKMMLHWVVSAKRPETKEKRSTEIAEFAARKSRPPRFVN